ncbi:tripartite tricarboxylate transporter TctB family protein [Oceanibium sediminis]|uniref:tripartite tricarboxylate transporter TctB family protein n=1 Tax=Oceanibium sediminis TaxID=2026339 RepID=UPI000DD3D04E|nr:tripartite tricarboxylate transporter TctB family protein [Oceanibium sediminis]
MKKLLFSSALLWMAFLATSIFLLVSSFEQSDATFVLPGDAPPFLVSQLILTCLILLSGSLLISRLVQASGGLPDADWDALAAVVVIVCTAGVLLKPLGFLAVSPVAAILTARVLGYRNWLINAVVAVAGVACLYLLLVKAARLPLPPVPGLGF